MTFDFDTSGSVQHPTRELPYRWSDLSPFAQGYIRAAKRDFPIAAAASGETSEDLIDWAFFDLHPDTLASMLADCEENPPGDDPDRSAFDQGRDLWAQRVREGIRLSLDPNGKVIAHV